MVLTVRLAVCGESLFKLLNLGERAATSIIYLGTPLSLQILFSVMTHCCCTECYSQQRVRYVSDTAVKHNPHFVCH